MKLIIYSDLHLEFGTDFMPADGDVLILAGDIITLKDFKPLDKFLKGWKKPVLYVAGNHEYYTQKPMQKCEEDLIGFLTINHPNVTFMRNEGVTIDGVNFFGGTMWTNFRDENPMAMAIAHRSMNDYRLIINGEEALTPQDTVGFHKEYVAELEKWFNEDLSGSRVVISHHAPCVNPNGFHRGSNLQPAYNSLDMIPIILKYKPELFIYGHCHEFDDQIIGETRIVSNPRGYPLRNGGSECKEFMPDGMGIIL